MNLLSWLDPYRIYLKKLLIKITPEKLRWRIKDVTRSEEQDCRLPEDLKEFDFSSLESAIADACENADKQVEKINQDRTPDWESVRNTISQCLAEVFEGFHHGFEVKYMNEAGEVQAFRLPDLSIFGIQTGGLRDFYKNFDYAFSLIKKQPSRPENWNWEAIKDWGSYAGEFFKT